MKTILALTLFLVATRSFAASKVTCGEQIRTKVTAAVQSSVEFKTADPTKDVGVRDIGLNEHMNGLVEVSVTYGSLLSEEAPQSEMNFTATADPSCKKISIQRTR